MARQVERLAIFTHDLFATSHDEANRAAVASVAADLDLAGIALHADRKPVDTVLDKLRHPLTSGTGPLRDRRAVVASATRTGLCSNVFLVRSGETKSREVARQMRRQFWAAVVVGGISAVIAVITVVSHEWIEFVFGVEPDNGNGSLEWAIVIVTALIALTCLGWARVEWRRTQAAVISGESHG